MIGFGGVYLRSGEPLQAEVLDRMSCSLSSFPGTQNRQWISQSRSVGLISKIDFTLLEGFGEEQLFLNLESSLAIVANARLDNRQEVLKQLGIADRLDLTDSQIILAAYRAWGENSPTHLLGDFAFAIWDNDNQRLFCARDPFGVRPFYYYASRKLFVFGSAMQAVLALKDVPRQLNEDKVADFLFEMFEDKARTFYQDVFRLPPAHWMVVTQETIRIQRYWKLDADAEIRLANDAEYAEAYRDLFIQAVRCRLRGAVTIGSTLSGGLDSSSVACVAGRLLEHEGRQLHTVSAIFETVRESDEREYIRAVLDEGHYEAHFAAGDRANPISDLYELIPEESEPYYSPQLYLSRAIWATAQTHGIRVLLEGLLGDNVVSHGYALLNELGRRWRWVSLYHQFRSLAQRHPHPQSAWEFMSHSFWQDGIKSNLPASALQAWRKLRGGRPEDMVRLPRFITPEFARRVHLEDRFRLKMVQAASVRTARQQHYLELEDGIIPTAMEIYHAEAGRFGIEPRFPFLDRRLVEFCLAVPPDQKLKDGYTRYIARQGLKSYLPKQTQQRTSKGDLSWNFVRGLAVDQPLFNRILSSSAAKQQTYFDLSVIQSTARRVIAGDADPDSGLYVFLCAAMILWLDSGGVSKSISQEGVKLSQIQA